MQCVIEASAVPDNERAEYHLFEVDGKQLAAKNKDIGNADIKTSQIRKAIEHAVGDSSVRVTRLPHCVQDLRQRIITRDKRRQQRLAGKRVRLSDLASQLDRIERMLKGILEGC
jgi:hypothetical protein